MSALNIVKRKNDCVIISDAAAYDACSGLVMGFGVKQWPVPSWPGVIGVRGTDLAGPLYAHLLSFRFATWDAMVAGIEAEIEAIHNQVVSICSAQGATDTDETLSLAGYSAARGPESYSIVMSENVSAVTLEDEKSTVAVQSEPFKLYKSQGLAFGPLVSDKDLEATGLLDSSGDERPEFWRAMIRLLTAQRKTLFLSRDSSSPPFSAVGGFALCSIVDRRGVRSFVLHHWKNDRVGFRIVVDGAEAPVEKRTGNGKDAHAPIVGIAIGGTRGDYALRSEPYAPPTETTPPVAIGGPQGSPIAGAQDYLTESQGRTIYGEPAGPAYAPFGERFGEPLPQGALDFEQPSPAGEFFNTFAERWPGEALQQGVIGMEQPSVGPDTFSERYGTLPLAAFPAEQISPDQTIRESLAARFGTPLEQGVYDMEQPQPAPTPDAFDQRFGVPLEQGVYDMEQPSPDQTIIDTLAGRFGEALPQGAYDMEQPSVGPDTFAERFGEALPEAALNLEQPSPDQTMGDVFTERYGEWPEDVAFPGEQPSAAPFEEPGRTAMGRAADRAYEPPDKMVINFEKNIDKLIANTPADKREQSKEFWGYVTDKQKADLAAGRTNLETVIRENYPRAGGIIIQMMNAQVPGGVRAVQDMLLSKSADTKSVAEQVADAWRSADELISRGQFLPSTQGLPPEEMPPIGTGGPQAAPPWTVTNQPPPAANPETLAPPWTVTEYPPSATPNPAAIDPYQGAFPPGVHEIPGGLPPTQAAPPSISAPTAPPAAAVNEPIAIIGDQVVTIGMLAAALLSGSLSYNSEIIDDLGEARRRLLRRLLEQPTATQMAEGGHVPQYATPGRLEGMTDQEYANTLNEEDPAKAMELFFRSGYHMNPSAWDQWIERQPDYEHIIDERTPLSDPSNLTSARFREEEEVNREADRIRAERERRERAEKHGKR